MLLSVAVALALAEEIKSKPENLTMTLAYVADAGEPRQYVFVIGTGLVAYKTVEGLKKFVKTLPKGSTLTWAPSCRQGGGPLLDSEDDMKKFREFCESIGIKFVLVPSG